jgi:hypothetical protein
MHAQYGALSATDMRHALPARDRQWNVHV